jgi:hypothetical protein
MSFGNERPERQDREAARTANGAAVAAAISAAMQASSTTGDRLRMNTMARMVLRFSLAGNDSFQELADSA